MSLPARVEFPISDKSNLFSRYKTMGDLKGKYPNIKFVKYIYVDPIDKMLKCENPPDDLPIVANAYLTITGETIDIMKFLIDETKEDELI